MSSVFDFTNEQKSNDVIHSGPQELWVNSGVKVRAERVPVIRPLSRRRSSRPSEPSVEPGTCLWLSSRSARCCASQTCWVLQLLCIQHHSQPASLSLSCRHASSSLVLYLCVCPAHRLLRSSCHVCLLFLCLCLYPFFLSLCLRPSPGVDPSRGFLSDGRPCPPSGARACLVFVYPSSGLFLAPADRASLSLVSSPSFALLRCRRKRTAGGTAVSSGCSC